MDKYTDTELAVASMSDMAQSKKELTYNLWRWNDLFRSTKDLLEVHTITGGPTGNTSTRTVEISDRARELASELLEELLIHANKAIKLHTFELTD